MIIFEGLHLLKMSLNFANLQHMNMDKTKNSFNQSILYAQNLHFKIRIMMKNVKPKYTNDYGLCNQKIGIRLALTKIEIQFYSASIQLFWKNT